MIASESMSACLLDGKGGARDLAPDGLAAWQPEHGVLWVTGPAKEAGSWLESAVGADPADVELFTRDPAQPWVEFVRPEVLVLVLVHPRGAAQDPANPGWKGVFRMWASARLVLTVGTPPAVADVRGALAQGRGPRDAAGLLASLCERAADRTRAALLEQDSLLTAVEAAFTEERDGTFDEVVALRRNLLALRRRCAALRLIADRLRSTDAAWLATTRRRWRTLEHQAIDDVSRLDALLDRAQGLQDRHAQRAADHTNRVLYIVSLFTASFTPLAFVAGVFGMNVGVGEASVAGLSRPVWFFLVTAALLLLGVFQLRFMRRLRPP